jgi:hypothetical protein
MDVSTMIDEHPVQKDSASLYSPAVRRVPPLGVERTDARGVSRCQALEEGARERLPAIMAQRASHRAAAQTDTRED